MGHAYTKKLLIAYQRSNLTGVLYFYLLSLGAIGRAKHKRSKWTGKQKVVFEDQCLYFHIKYKGTLWTSHNHFPSVKTATFIPSKLVKIANGRDFDFALIWVLLLECAYPWCNTSSTSPNLKSIAVMWENQVSYRAISCWQMLKSAESSAAMSSEKLNSVALTAQLWWVELLLLQQTGEKPSNA